MVKRLPCKELLPSGWMATMRPTPVMIPVNIDAIFAGFGTTSRPKVILKTQEELYQFESAYLCR
jgi:hypothetical protein